MKISLGSKLLLVIAVTVLISNVAIISRDYQDSWILEGLEISFTLFVITYAAAFFFERRISWMVALAIVGRTVFLLIPNLKYVWFQGTYIDQHVQYALANHVYNEGHIYTQPVSLASERGFAPQYTTTPFLHLYFSIFSMIPNVPIVDSMKYIPVLFSATTPLLTYILVKYMKFSRQRTILKYALFISSVPFSLEQYVVTGGLYGILLAFLFLSTLVLIFEKSDRRFWVVCTIVTFALAATHSVTSAIIMISLLAITALQRATHFGPKSHLRASAVFAVASITIAWLAFQANPTLQVIIRQFFVSVPGGTTPQSEYISASFYEHARVNAFSAVKSVIAFYGADVFFLLLSLASVIILLKMRKHSRNVTKFLLLFGLTVFFFMIIGFFMKLGAPRALQFMRILFPVFSGVFILHISRNARARSWAPQAILLIIMLLSSIELYRCQPLISPANVLYRDLPPDVPMGFIGIVNSIYQRQMISFAENHIEVIIAASSPTANQIVGLTDIDFSTSNLIRHYPLDKRLPEQEYDHFLIHLGKSGIPHVEPRLRTRSLILEAICSSSIVYTNGDSYILAQTYIDNNT